MEEEIAKKSDLQENNSASKSKIKKSSLIKKNELDEDLYKFQKKEEIKNIPKSNPVISRRNFDIIKKNDNSSNKIILQKKKSFDSVSQKNKGINYQKISRERKKSFSVVYPITILLFFLFLFSFSTFLQYSFKKNSANLENLKSQDFNSNSKKVSNSNDLNKNSDKKNSVKKNESIFSMKTKDVLARIIYQPVKKNNSTELVLDEASSAIILDVNSGKVLFSKNATDKRAIASLTKLVTAMIVIDRVKNLDEEVVISSQALAVDGTKVGCSTSYKCEYEKMYVGEKVKVRDLLQSMLMLSANDSATALAIYVSGSEDEFAKLMNARMKELGLENSNFCRPSGLELDDESKNENCYSSAYDISKIMTHLLKYKKYDILFEIMKTEEATFTSIDGKTVHNLKNTNRILNEFPGILGGKTGFTSRAGYSLAMALESSDKKHKIVCTVLNDNKRFDDIKKMAEWTFTNFEWK